MGYKASNIVELHPATLEAKNLETNNVNINPSTGLASTTIVAYASGRSYKVNLQNGLREVVGSKAFHIYRHSYSCRLDKGMK